MNNNDKHKEWVAGIAKGNKLAFEHFYAAFSAKVYNTALSYLQNEQEAEEATQDVFLQIYRSAATFEARARVSTWVYRITVNKCLDALKSRRPRGLLWRFGDASAFDAPDFRHPGLPLEKQEDAALLFKAVDGLPDKQKTAFILGHIEEFPRQEVADIMGLSLKAVESLLQRAKENLRKKLEKSFPHRRKA